jgi:DNA-binding beta-propeller fold protein YncE
MATAAVLASVLTAASASAATPTAYVYATSWSQTVRQYAADDAGVLSPLEPPEVAAGLTSTEAAASPDRRSLYVVNQTSNSVSEFDIAADGTLNPKTPASVPTGRSPVALDVAPDGQHVYVVNQGDETVSSFSVDATGALTRVSDVATGAAPIEIAASPDGASVYVTNFSGGTVSQYDVTTAGALAPKAAGPVAAGSRPAGIAVSGDGGSVYVTNQLASGTVRSFSVNAESGALTSGASVAAGSQPRGIAVGAGRVYVSNVASNTISQYADDGAGALRPLAPAVSAPGSPFGLALSPDQRSLYVALFAAPAVGQYDVAGDGTLSVKADPEPASFRPQSVVAVKPRDEQAPTIDLVTPADGAEYEQGAAVTVDYTCADEGGSGLQSCTGDVPDGDPLDTSSPGAHSFTVVARDGAGHETTLTHAYSVARDAQAPTIDLVTPADGAHYEQGAAVAVDYTCADEGGSGLQSCTGDVPDGDPLDTSSPGSHDFTVVARDGAGNETTMTHSYTVTAPSPPGTPDPGLDFQGFLGPIHDGSVVRAGDAIPIVFSLGGDQGLDVLAAGSPSSALVDCDHPGAPTGGEPAWSKSGRGLVFHSWTGHYVFMWQTRKSWAGTCRTFVLGLRDGSVERLTVSFRSSWGWHPHQ